MVDKTVENEWEKSKRIEAEKLKAAKALAEEQPSKANLAYLDPKHTKVKGFSKDKDVILASLERYADRSFIFATAAVLFEAIGKIGALVTMTNHLGSAGVMISGIPDGIGMLLLGLAAISVVVAICGEVYFKIKLKRKFGSAFWSAVFALPLIGAYFLIRVLVV